MTTKKILGMWMLPSGIEIIEELNGDRHAYDISYGGKHVVTIYADSPEVMGL